MSIDVNRIREDFPILKETMNGHPLVYLDSGATTLKPQVVIDAVNHYNTKKTSNVHRGVYQLSNDATELYEGAREKVKQLINAKKVEEIVFTKGATHALNLVAQSYGLYNLKAGDEIIVSELEHHSSFLPWQHVARVTGAVLKFIPLDETGHITVENFKKVLSDKTKVVAINYVSNVMGYVSPIKEITALAREVGAIISVDAAQAAPHMKIDVQDLDCDFLSFSGHKMCGPTGVGVLYGKYELLNKILPINYGGGMNTLFEHDGYYELKSLPHRLEAGTPNIAGVIGLGSAIEYVNNIGIDNIIKYEEELKKYLLEKLKELDFITIYNANSKGPVVAFNIKGVFSQDASVYLDKYNICIRAGNHCTKMLKDEINIKNTCRISLALYNNKEEIDLLINVLKNSKNIWKEIL